MLERFELAELLVQWGCPDDEVNAYLEHTDGNDDGQISFDEEFYPHMAPIWKFGFETVLHHKAKAHARRGWAAGDEAATPRSPRNPAFDGVPRASITAASPRASLPRTSLAKPKDA